MTNRAKEVKAKIKELIDERTKTAADILEKIEAERRAEDAAQEAINKATTTLDFAMNHRALEDKAAAAERRSLLQRRFDQLNGKKQVTEAESDEVISSLLQYEKDLEAAFEEDVSAPLAELKKICSDYLEKVRETEDTLNAWTQEIHPNYRSQYTKYADGSNRSANPVPVHSVEYVGSSLSKQINTFLREIFAGKK